MKYVVFHWESTFVREIFKPILKGTTNKPTHPSTRIYNVHLDWRSTLCWWPSPPVNMSTRTWIHAPCLSTLEHSKSHADQHIKNKNNGLLRNPCPPPRPGGSTLAQPKHAPIPRVLTLSHLRPPLVSYPRRLQFEYHGLILDPILTMHLATVEAIRRASKGQALAVAVSYSLRYYKKTPPNLPPHKTLDYGNQ